MRELLRFLCLWVLAPAAGCAAMFLWLLAMGIAMGFSGMGMRASEFFDSRNYAPFAQAMFIAAPLAYYPAYTLCRHSPLRFSRVAFVVCGAVASLFPAVVIALEDGGNILKAIGNFNRFGAEVLEMETLVTWASFAAPSVALSVAYMRLTRDERQIEAWMRKPQS